MTIATLTAFAAPAVSQPAAAEQCLSMNEARNAVAEGLAVSFSQLRGQVPELAGSEVVSAQLCTTGSGYYYLVSVLEGGTVKTVTVNAGGGAGGLSQF